MPKIIENLEDRLIQEARRQIEENGYHALTIRSVAGGCGVGVGTVYHYFPSKDALVAACMLQDWRICLAAIGEMGDTCESARPLMRCIYDQLTDFSRRHQGIFRNEAASAAFAGSFSRYHALLRSQLAAPLRPFCRSDFSAEFTAEALLTWTMAETPFDELYAILQKLL